MERSTTDNKAISDSAVMPPGPWLMVVGMHRSGTSAVTGAIGALGFTTPHPDDRWGWHATNPDHWESVSINKVDEKLLALMGGSWEAPPELPANWDSDIERRQLPDTVAAVRVAFPDPGPLVWKDPRVCLLLPYWRRILPPPLAAVLVWRSPLSVARSVQGRDRGMHFADGVAMWERYNRCALEHLAGVDTYVIKYESVLDDPPAVLTAIADWLSMLPQFAPHASQWDPEGAAAMITTSRSLEADVEDHDGLLLAQHRELMTRLSALEGGHRPLGPSSLMSESGWTTALLADRRGSRTRELDKLEAERIRLEAQLKDTRIAQDRLHRSTSWRVTKPLRSLVSLIRG